MQATETNVNASGAPVQPASQIEIPKWATGTPDEIDYDLGMFDENGRMDGVALTRGEYIGLKRHLAKMRGFEVPEAESEAAPAEAAGAESLKLTDLTARETEYLRTCLEIHRNDRGALSPFEEFFTRLVQGYTGGYTAAEDVRLQFDEFQENWEGAVRDIGVVMRHCPKLVEEATAANRAN